MKELKRYVVLRRASDATLGLITEVVSAPSKKLLKSYYEDWDSDNKKVQYTTLFVTRVSESTYEKLMGWEV